MNLFTKEKQTYRLRELAYHCRGGVCGGEFEGKVREFWMDMYTRLY